jgi:hypothetical protein
MDKVSARSRSVHRGASPADCNKLPILVHFQNWPTHKQTT